MYGKNRSSLSINNQFPPSLTRGPPHRGARWTAVSTRSWDRLMGTEQTLSMRQESLISYKERKDSKGLGIYANMSSFHWSVWILRARSGCSYDSAAGGYILQNVIVWGEYTTLRNETKDFIYLDAVLSYSEGWGVLLVSSAPPPQSNFDVVWWCEGNLWKKAWD